MERDRGAHIVGADEDAQRLLEQVAQADQPVSGLLAVAVSYVFTFFCSFIYLFILFLFLLLFKISSASLLFNFFFFFFIVESLLMNIAVIGLGLNSPFARLCVEFARAAARYVG